jgi:hypothetical protein
VNVELNLEDIVMSNVNIFSKPPFNAFPFNTFIQIIDKLEYLGKNEEQTPYEVSPGTDLCISDTYYSLSFLTYLHSFGKVINPTENNWKLETSGKPQPDKPYRFVLIESATKVLESLKSGFNKIEEIDAQIPELSINEIDAYLRILVLITQRGKVVQHSKGWDASYVLKDW